MKSTHVLSMAAVIVGIASSANGQFFENFDSYAAGSQIHGVNGWKGWANNASAGALVSNAQSLSAPNSIEITGASDLVHEFTGANSGLWQWSANVFVPQGFSGTSYMILMSDYNDPGVNMHWSVQMTMNGTTNLVGDDQINGGTVTPTALIVGQWVPVVVDINLTANTRVVRYNGNIISGGTWTDGTTGTTGATMNVGAVDLFANNASPVYWDNLRLQPVPEPASMVALALGAGALLRRRRKQA